MERYSFLKKLRLSRGMTQTQVGILAGMSKSQVSRMESGTLGSPETVERVLAALGYDMVISYRDVRPAGTTCLQEIMDQLRVYYIYNKDRFGIEKLGIFGSVARSEETPSSDIDVIISLKKPSFFLYGEITRQLQEVFGRKVDLVSAKSHMPEEFKSQIEKDAIYVS